MSAAAVTIEQFRGETTAREIEGFGIFCPEAFFQLQNQKYSNGISDLLSGFLCRSSKAGCRDSSRIVIKVLRKKQYASILLITCVFPFKFEKPKTTL